MPDLIKQMSIPQKYIDEYKKNYGFGSKQFIEYSAKKKFLSEKFEKMKIEDLRLLCDKYKIHLKYSNGKTKNKSELIDSLILYMQDTEDYLKTQASYKKSCKIDFDKYSLDVLKKLCDSQKISYPSKITKVEMVKKLNLLIKQ